MSETGYPTEKNASLLKRIVEASSNPGDLVLDCFCGSGTTLKVSRDLGRRWIGVDSSTLAIQTTIERLCASPDAGSAADQQLLELIECVPPDHVQYRAFAHSRLGRLRRRDPIGGPKEMARLI